MFGLESRADYVKKWEIVMKAAYALAMKNSSTSSADGRRQYDRKVRFSVLKPRDRVLVRNLSARSGPGKLPSF